MKKKVKALLLFSGGLDSLLAVEILKKQKIEVTALHFRSCFFDSQPVEKMAQERGLKLKIIDIAEEHLALAKSPLHGYGKEMNPCLDCRILMLRRARELMMEKGYDFVASGEVLGERPMTQQRQAMKLVEKEAGIQGLLLRPLSARLLQLTIPEKKKWVDRQKLYDFSGRSRQKQIDLARKFGLKNYPAPAGGCLLTDPEFSKKFRQLLKIFPAAGLNDIELLKNGRQFWEGKTRIVIGRDEKENKILGKLSQAGDLLISLKKVPGPTALLRSYTPKKNVPRTAEEKAEQLIIRYALKAKKIKEPVFQRKIK
jgi:tRNA-uridine 2-sulfurtransferase